MPHRQPTAVSNTYSLPASCSVERFEAPLASNAPDRLNTLGPSLLEDLPERLGGYATSVLLIADSKVSSRGITSLDSLR